MRPPPRRVAVDDAVLAMNDQCPGHGMADQLAYIRNSRNEMHRFIAEQHRLTEKLMIAAERDLAAARSFAFRPGPLIVASFFGSIAFLGAFVALLKLLG